MNTRDLAGDNMRDIARLEKAFVRLLQENQELKKAMEDLAALGGAMEDRLRACEYTLTKLDTVYQASIDAGKRGDEVVFFAVGDFHEL